METSLIVARVASIARLGVSQASTATDLPGASRSESVVLAVLTLISGAVIVARAPLGGDETAMLVYGERIAGGEVPNRDFFTVYGPGTYRLMQGLFNLTGPSVWVERAVGIFYHVAIVLGVMALTSRFGRRASTAAGITSTAVLLWFILPAYAWLGGTALFVWSLALLARTDNRAWIVFSAGLLSGLIPFWRLEMGILILAATPLLWNNRRRLRLYALGLAIGLTPTIFHMASAGTGVIRNVFAERLGINAQSVISTVEWNTWLLLGLCVAGPAIVLLCAKSDTGQRKLLIAIALGQLLALPQALQRIDIYHAVFVACFSVPATVAVLMRFAPRLAAISRPTRLAAACVLVIGVVGASVFIATWKPLPLVTNSGRSLPLVAEDAARLSQVIDMVHAHVPAGSSVFVGPSDMTYGVSGDIQLYHLMPEYRNTFYFDEFAPGVTERQGSRLLGDVMSADALILTDLDSRDVRESLPNVPRGDSDVNDVVRTQFCIKGSVGKTHLWTKGPC